MPAPTNLDALTAIDITTLPYAVTQDVNDSGVTYEVWYKYTAVAGDNELGLFGFGNNVGTGYRPFISIYYGNPNAPTFYGLSAQNKPVQFNVVVGETYYFQFTPNGTFGTANLSLGVYRFTDVYAPAGSLIINDDTTLFPAVIVTATGNYTPLRFINTFPAGEQGDSLDNNGNPVYLFEDGSARAFNLYDKDLNLLSIIPAPWGSGTLVIRSSNAQNKFYVGTSAGPKVNTIDAAGNLGTEFTVTGADLHCMACNNAGTILYSAGNSGGQNRIRRWQIGVGALSNLVGDMVGYSITDMLVLADDSIVAIYQNATEAKAIVYNTSGVVLSTKTITGQNTLTNKLAYALDDPISYWAWTHTNTPTRGLSKFTNIKASDGTTISEKLEQEYEGGVYEGSETATPIANFGNSFSCPFVVLRFGVGTPPPPPFDESIPSGSGGAADGCIMGLDTLPVTGRDGCTSSIHTH